MLRTVVLDQVFCTSWDCQSCSRRDCQDMLAGSIKDHRRGKKKSDWGMGSNYLQLSIVLLVTKETDQAGYILKFERDEVELGLPARSQDADNDLAARFEHAFADFVVGRLAHVNASH